MRTQIILLILLLTSLSVTTNAQINANPDPTKVEVTLCSSRTQDCTIEIFDERGRSVSILQNINTTNILNVSGYTPGIYHVRLLEKGLVVETVKLIVQ